MVLATGSKSSRCVGAVKMVGLEVSTVKRTWPLGKIAAGASSAPHVETGSVGPVAQVFEDGEYRTVLLFAPIWKTRPSGSSIAGPSSNPYAEPDNGTGTGPVSTHVLVEGM